MNEIVFVYPSSMSSVWCVYSFHMYIPSRCVYPPMIMSPTSAPYVCSLSVAVTSMCVCPLYVQYMSPSSAYVCLFRVLYDYVSSVCIYLLWVNAPPPPILCMFSPLSMSSPWGVSVSFAGTSPPYDSESVVNRPTRRTEHLGQSVMLIPGSRTCSIRLL